MEKAPEFRNLRKSDRYALSAVLFAAGSLVLTGCGGSDRPESSKSSPPPASAEASSTSATVQTGGERHTLVFDDLHGGSTIIQV